MTGRLLAVGVLALALVLPGAAQGATKVVTAGPDLERPPRGLESFDANAFFPNRIQVNRGDRIAFKIRGFHNVAFVPQGTTDPPLVREDLDNRVAGAVDAAGAPFWFNGRPDMIVNPLVAFPQGSREIDGEALAGSGLPSLEGDAPPPDYRVSFPERGTFRFVCNVHPGMEGRVRVKGPNADVPSKRADRRRARRQLDRLVLLGRRLARFDGPRGPAVRAGNDRRQAAHLAFFPRRKTVRAGERVLLQMSPTSSEVHTFTFGPEDYLEDLVRRQILPVPQPAGPPKLRFLPEVVYPSDPPPAFPPYTPTLHGNGFFNTGLMDSVRGNPLPGRYGLRFAEPGDFGFICLIHPFMRGTIRVRA